jgi:hypothetical protein
LPRSAVIAEEFVVGIAITNHVQRPEPAALASTLETLAARFGNRLITRSMHPPAASASICAT